MNKELREKLIDKLVEGEVNTNGGGGDWFLRDVLRQGCGGFENMSDEDLVNMAISVNIDPTTGEDIVDADGLEPEPPGA